MKLETLAYGAKEGAWLSLKHSAMLRLCRSRRAPQSQRSAATTNARLFVQLSTERAASEGSAVHIGATPPQSTGNEGLFLLPSSVLQRDGALEDARPALYIHEACAAQVRGTSDEAYRASMSQSQHNSLHRAPPSGGCAC